MLLDDSLSPAEKAVLVLFETIAFALGWGAVERFLVGASPFVVVPILLASFAMSYVGFQWPKIKQKVSIKFASGVERWAVDYRFRLGAILLTGFVTIFSLLLYMHSLRSDLDTYAMPRTVTERQAKDLHKYLLENQQYAVPVTVKAEQGDREAVRYASELVNAFADSGWIASLDTSDVTIPLSRTLNDGCNVKAIGINSGPPDPRHEPQNILVSALDASHIHCGQEGEGAGDYKLFLAIGHRPIRLEGEDSPLFKLGRWLEGASQ